MDVIEKRKRVILGYLKNNFNYLIWIVFFLITFFGMYIRTRNLKLLKDVTTNDYIPLALDPFAFLRYVKYIVAHGKLMAVDTLRYYPLGYSNLQEFSFLSHFIAYLYKIWHLIDPSVTVAKVHVLYPPIAFGVGLVFFFLLVKKIFNWRVAIMSSTILSVIPTYLYRTMAGFSDKEPLALAFMSASFYFYVSSIKSEKIVKAIIFGCLSGLFTGFMGLVWGGVKFMFLIFGTFAILAIIFDLFEKKDIFSYLGWGFFTIITLYIGYPNRYNFSTFAFSLTTIPMIFAFLVCLIKLLIFDLDSLKSKEKLTKRLPSGILSVILAFAVVFIFSIFYDPSFLFGKFHDVFNQLIHPFQSRWSLTVAESHQPYFKDLIHQLNWKFTLFMLFGGGFLFFDMLSNLKKKKAIKGVILFVCFVILFVLSRYSGSSTIFNGKTFISNFFYIGSILGIFGFSIFYLLRSFYKEKETYSALTKLKPSYLFVFIWFFYMLLATRTAIRLFLLFAPIFSIFFSFAVEFIFKSSFKIKDKSIRVILWIFISIMFILCFVNYSKAALSMAPHTGPSYNQQWQIAMKWVRENTPKDAVFAHWWDYGYWVQTGGGRATLSDGGNARGAINHFIGRHVLTAHSETEALELLKANNATHLLIIKDEIGKYPAFSSIGADENYDRYSWISTFVLSPRDIQEKRNETIYVYRGTTPLDDDLIYKDVIFPARSSGIVGFMVPFINAKNKTLKELIRQPTAVLVYNGKLTYVPLKYVFIEGTELEFEKEGLPGTLMFIPSISGGKVNPIGAALYLSPEVRQTLFTKLFLFGEKSKYFKLVYTDEEQMPLALYEGTLIGPLKIWEISYPDNLTIPPEYYGTTLPNPNVTKVREEFY